MNRDRFIDKLFWRMQYEKSKRVALGQLSVFSDPDSAVSFFQFDKHLREKTNTQLEPLYQLRFQEIDRVLRRYDVKSVLEIGTGRTTFFFNLYPRLDVVSYEQDKRWRDILLAFYNESALSPPRIVSSKIENYKNGARFVSQKDNRCDLLYIDGPYVNCNSGKFPTYTGKPAYYDFERVLEAKFPKIIMIEGRTDTVDAFLESSYAANYDFYGELTWALERNRYLHALRLNRHSIFVRK